MTAKEYLSQAFLLDRQINSYLTLIEDLKRKAISVSAQTIKDDKIQASMSGDRTSSLISKIVDLETELNEKIDRYIDLKQEIVQKIEAVENPKYKLILQERYLNFKKWEQIAVDNDIDLRWVYRIHSKALSEIKVDH